MGSNHDRRNYEENDEVRPGPDPSAYRNHSLLNESRSGARFQLDLSESSFILSDILLNQSQKRFCLLWAQINTLKILYFHVLRLCLVNRAEQQKKVPEVDSNLDAVGISFPVIVCLLKNDPGRVGCHRPSW